MPSTAKVPALRRVDYNMEELQFSRTSHHLSHILDQHPLPRVIQCDRKTAPPTGSTGTSLDLTKPLLAYSKRSVRKVHAYNVVFDSRSREFLPVGNNLLVPEDYTGWFFVLGPEDSVSQDTPVPYYRSLAELAASTCSTFLTAGHDLLDAFLMQSRHHSPCKILPGTLLHMCGLYPEVEPEIKGNKPKKGKKFTPRWFLKCIDEQDRELLVCTSQMGRFYVIEQSDVPVKHPFMQIKTILERYKFPLLVKLVYGRVPTTPCSFTSTLLLTNCGKNHTVVASTLLNCRNINLEIPVATDMKFHIAEETPDLKGSKIYTNAVRVCREQVFTYVKNIKVIYGEPLLEADETEDTPKNNGSDQTKNNGSDQSKNNVSDQSKNNGSDQSKNNGSDQTKNNGSDQSKNNGSDQSEVKTPPKDDSAHVQLRPRSTTRKRGSRLSVLSRSNMDEVLKRLTITEEDPAMFSHLSPESPNGLDSVKESNESFPDSVETSPSVTTPGEEWGSPTSETVPVTPHDSSDKRQAFQNRGHDDSDSHEYYNDCDHSFTHEYDNSSFSGSLRSSGSDTSSGYVKARDSQTSAITIDCVIGQPDLTASGNRYTPMEEHSAKPAKNEKPKLPPKPSRKGEDIGGSDDRSDTSSLSSEKLQTDNDAWYNTPIHVDHSASNTYGELKDNSPEQNLSDTQNTYAELVDDNEETPVKTVRTTDSRVSDDVETTPTPNDEAMSTEGVTRSRHNCRGPLLPPRPEVSPTGPPPQTLGQAVVQNVAGSDVQVPAVDQSNRDRLIEELRGAGVSHTTQLAFQGLEFAKIAMLLQCRDEDVQDQLIALLPKVGQVDLRKIALCLKEMKLA